MRYAPQMAMKKITTFSAVSTNVGLKISVNAAPIGIQSAITTTFQPAKYATSWWSGCKGRSSSPDSWPCRIRHSQNGAPKTMFMLRTSVQTMY